MPNGGHMCCAECAYSVERRCDIHGVPVSVGLVCRSFRVYGQTHDDAKKQWPELLKLQPGVVYGIDNSAGSAWNPVPRFRLDPVPFDR